MIGTKLAEIWTDLTVSTITLKTVANKIKELLDEKRRYDKRQIRTKGGPIIPDPDALFNIAKCRCFEKKYPLAPEPKESDFQIEKCKCKVTDE